MSRKLWVRQDKIQLPPCILVCTVHRYGSRHQYRRGSAWSIAAPQNDTPPKMSWQTVVLKTKTWSHTHNGLTSFDYLWGSEQYAIIVIIKTISCMGVKISEYNRGLETYRWIWTVFDDFCLIFLVPVSSSGSLVRLVQHAHRVTFWKPVQPRQIGTGNRQFNFRRFHL